MEGRAPRATPRHIFGAAASFQFTPHLGLNLSARYYSSFSVDNAGGITDPKTGFVSSNDGRRDLNAPAYAVWNVGLSYRWKTNDKSLHHIVRGTVKNAFDKRYIVVGADRTLGDSRGIYLTYTVEH